MTFLRHFLLASCLLLVTAVSGSCRKSAGFSDDPQIRSVQQLASRILPHRWGGIDFVLEPSETSFHRLETVDGRLRISGDCANSLAAGLGDYLRDCCHINVSWFVEDRIREPRRLPSVPEAVTREAIAGKRFFLNYCTYGYSLNFWKWEQWERLIDWMALNGVNMALANTGQEAVWQKVWMQMGMTAEQTRDYFTGPSYLSWHRMTNIDGWHGPLPQGWLDGQVELQKNIIDREISLGISPILSMFTGHVPKAMKELYPDADIRKLSAWGDFEEKYNPWYLSPADPLFKEIAGAFMKAQKELFGQDCHIYGVDLFNEVDPPVWEAEYLSDVARRTYETMSENDPEAVWLQMSWLFWHKKKNWTPDLVEAYITPVPKHRLIMLDYYCEKTEIWRETNAFHGQDYIWSYLGNFGGNTMIAGNFADISSKLDRVCKEGGEGFVGIGCTLEGLDVNPVMYSYVLDRAWTKTDDQTWIRNWADSRSGSNDGEYREAWSTLMGKVYRDIAGNRSSIVTGRPTLAGHSKWSNTVLAYDNRDLFEAWGHLVKSAAKPSPARDFDLVNVARQCVSNCFGTHYKAFCKAYTDKDADALKAQADTMLEALRDLERLTAADRYFLLGRWTSMARSWGADEAEKAYYDWDARAIVSCWGFEGGKLNDYANREWNGLVGTYYLPRWERFTSGVIDAVREGRDFDEAAFIAWSKRFEWEWVSSEQHFAEKPSGNPAKLSRELYRRWSCEF